MNSGRKDRSGEKRAQLVRPFWAWVAAWLFLLFVIALAARAHDATHRAPEDSDPALAEWFRSLARPSYPGEMSKEVAGSCCNEHDCFTLDPDAVEIRDDKYWVRDPTDLLEHKMLVVPPYRVLKRPDNPTGRAVACIYDHSVLCFIRPGGV